MKIRILSLASRDLLRGKRFYEQRAAGLGDYFIDSLSADIESLRIFAGIHRKIRSYHCLLAKRFPYAVYYRVEQGEIKVCRVLDCRQNPIKTERALAEEPNVKE